MSKEETFKIRSAGRHILTVGRDLIKDENAAIVELVKNAYDADAKNVKIDIRKTVQPPPLDQPVNQDAKDVKIKYNIDISVEDDGHGMTEKVVKDKWLVLSTDDKQNRKTSPSGRIMQGKKGIGRYAAAILGNKMLLDTVDAHGNNTTILLDWKKFENANFIDDVEILVETKRTKVPQHTKISINGGNEYAEQWTDKKIKNLYLELRKLISPFFFSKEKFDITLSYSGFNEESKLKVEPINVLEYFDYRISGEVENNVVSLKYENRKKGTKESKAITFLEQQKKKPNIGKIVFDIRVYDRDKESIEYLMERVPANEKKNFSSVTQSKKFLDEFIGIRVHRNGFRIRPLGDPGYDWLKLDERRVQNPSMRIGLNQVIGFIGIEGEDRSGLLEKSARDGLKENESYETLIELSHNVIWELEDRRYKFRRTLNDKKTSQSSIEILSNSEELKENVRKFIKEREILEQIEEAIDKDQAKRQKAVDDLQQKIAIYQRQATLGKIMNVVMHEGRKPLNYFSNQASNIMDYIKLLKKNTSEKTLNEIIRIMEEIKNNSKLLSDLFKRLDPLATGNRGRKKNEILADMLESNFDIFSEEIVKAKIKKTIDCDKSIKIECWRSDLAVIFANLIENSVYWLKENRENKNKEISVFASENENAIIIDFKDNGVGIPEENIESSIIFDPGYTTKPNGTGLGLALAGEAIERNKGKLEAYNSEKGVHFRLTFNKKVKE